MDKNYILRKIEQENKNKKKVAEIFYSSQIFSWLLCVTLLPCADLKQQHHGLRHDCQVSPRT